jgi:hypothetical protein
VGLLAKTIEEKYRECLRWDAWLSGGCLTKDTGKIFGTMPDKKYRSEIQGMSWGEIPDKEYGKKIQGRSSM